jgi:hypothetical protein
MPDRSHIIPRPGSEKATNENNLSWWVRDEAAFIKPCSTGSELVNFGGDGTTAKSANRNTMIGYSSLFDTHHVKTTVLHRSKHRIHWPSLLIGGSIGAAAAIILTELLFR